jgi:general secretion pathway protein D
MQVVPLQFGVKLTLERTLRSLTKAKITPDFSQSAIFIEGRREEIIRAIELIDLLDTPAMRGRYIGLIDFMFLDPAVFASKVITLLENEGIDAAIGKPAGKNLVLVPMEQMGAIAVFATNEFLLDRVKYWAEQLDAPGEGPDKQFFLYHPRYAKAVDLGKSIKNLLNLTREEAGSSSNEGGSTGNAPSPRRIVGSDSEDINVVVDETANVLVFHAAGNRYRSLLPLLRKLDVMPKQVMLDITIAEVSLKDEFKYGVEWALKQQEVNLTTQGAFGASAVGGIGLLIDGNKGPLTANFLTTNSLVNILSKPTLVVRDGASASITVGSSISVVGQTTQDPINGDRQTTSSEYRKTGVDVSVTPIVNAAGIISMEVSQSISNSVPGSSGSGGNPDIFDRAVKTSVLAASGQTVMLAGLISENVSAGGSGAPGFSKIPLLGHLFKAQSDISDRTELIMLITPRVLEYMSDWEPIMEDFRRTLTFMKVQGAASEVQ